MDRIPTFVLAAQQNHLSISASGGMEQSVPWSDFGVAMTSLATSQGWRWERHADGSECRFFPPDTEWSQFREQLRLHLQSMCSQTGARLHTVFVQRMTK